MPPQPSSPHAAATLRSSWEDQPDRDQAELTRLSLELGKLVAELLTVSQEGQIGATQLNNGHGQPAEEMSAAWCAHFVEFGMHAEQVGEAAVCLAAWATTLGAMLFSMAGTVADAEEVISIIEAARPLLDFYGMNADELIHGVITEAQGKVSATSEGAMSGLASIPSWASQHISAHPPTSDRTL